MLTKLLFKSTLDIFGALISKIVMAVAESQYSGRFYDVTITIFGRMWAYIENS